MKRLLLILFLVSLLTTCGENIYDDGDFFYLVNKQAQMPIVVRGNKGSGIFVLLIHGGPGGTALQKIGLPFFNHLEASYATVFYDQRSSGSSQGNSPDKYLTLPQFVEDLDKVIDILRYKYNNPKIFLMGHSWGGCLGTGYLADVTRQQKIAGWIEIDGAHNNPTGDSLSLQWMTAYAQAQINVHNEEDFWTYVLNWYAQNPNFTSDQLEHYAFIEKAHGYLHDPNALRTPSVYPAYTTDYVFNSPADITAQLTNYNHVIKNFIISDIDLTAQMGQITLPSLILWGEHDGIIPKAMAQQASDALGTSPVQKSVVILPNSGHYGFYEEPVASYDAVHDFIEAYK